MTKHVLSQNDNAVVYNQATHTKLTQWWLPTRKTAITVSSDRVAGRSRVMTVSTALGAVVTVASLLAVCKTTQAKVPQFIPRWGFFS